ncbi:MAG: hypothetical protein QOG50_3112 [Actinomycetota bacterium]|jgi:hypothetical protein|nr:hypothetical protein [Actinomycetota bacterium]
MSLPTTGPLPSEAPISVFVDESGRRRARLRILARTIVAAAGIYVLVVIAGLTGSVSLPGVHLGVLGHAAAGRAHASRLGRGSNAVPLPAALRPKGSTAKSTRARKPSQSAPGATSPASGPSIGTAPAAPSAGIPATTAGPKAPTTTTPLVTTTTTKAHGPPTTTAHGPPLTKPGLGKGRVKL